MAATGLKRDIIIVNEFTVPVPKGTNKFGGTRGGTPGDFVLRYMARAGATEPLAPIRKNRADVFIERYMARESATEALDVVDAGGLKKRMRRGQGSGGVAFGYGSVSLSDEALAAAAKDVQTLFESGHTVMKTVLSFDEDYLRRNKLIPEGFVAKKKGDYRGQLDQMKLRLAVMNGLDRMGRMLYDDLRYVAVIQVDTMHVHCHLAMVDAGAGRLAPDGTQRGKINDRAKSLIRRGIDSWLDEKKHVRHLSSAVGYERRNVVTFVKRWAHQQMLRESLPQFLLACLPSDRRKWRYATNAREMAKPNRLVREIVTDALGQPGSPYPEAMARVQRYADHRRRREGLDRRGWQRLVDQGRERIIERGVNGVYALLRALPKDALRIKTPMLEVMGMDYEDIAARAAKKAAAKGAERDGAEDLIGFGFRMRSYSSRLSHHVDQRAAAHQRVRQWEAAQAAGAASADSKAVYDLYVVEEAYHARVAAKYRHLLNFLPRTADWQPWVEEVTVYGEKLLSLESLRKDPSIRRMKDPQEAEAAGQTIYGQRGGALVSMGDADSLAEVDRRIAAMRETYATRLDDLRTRLAGAGLRLEDALEADDAEATADEADVVRPLTVTAGPEFDFEEVKALDLHHMRFDFARDVPVGVKGQRRYRLWAQQRASALEAAVAYLQASGQGEAVAELPLDDVRQMGELAATLKGAGSTLPSEVSALVPATKAVRSSTVTLGAGLQHHLHERIAQEVLQAAVTPDLEARDLG